MLDHHAAIFSDKHQLVFLLQLWSIFFFIYFEAVVVTVTAYFHFESETPKKNFQKYHETFQLSQITLSVAYVIYCSLQTIVSVIIRQIP